VILIDANLLLYARDSQSDRHDRAREWLTAQLNGSARVGLPWASLIAFVRIATHPRVYDRPLTAKQAWSQVEEWLSAGTAWIPVPTQRHGSILGDLIRRHDIRGNLVTDAALAALAIEHGLELCSADSDFARFPEVKWRNPLLPES